MKSKILFGTAVALFVVGASLVISATLSALSERYSKIMDAVQERLVYHTDHHAVLAACQQVLKNPQAAGFPPVKDGYAMIDGSQNGGPIPAELPAVLQNLAFEDMICSDGAATVMFGGGFGGWGFTTAPPDPLDRNPHWQLIPGLWYWTDEGGTFPRDLLKFPYYRTSIQLLAGGVLAIALAVTLAIRSRKKLSPSA
jgi:hypothetical protein